MEQSYKEKYEQALAKAKEQYNYPCMRSCMGILEEIFPELKESEDERIINIFRKVIYGCDKGEMQMLGDKECDDCLSWLKKQGEHAHFLSKIQVGDKVTRNEDGVLVNLSQLKRVAKPSKKQGEKEPTQSPKAMTKLEEKLSSLVVAAVHTYCEKNLLETPHFVGLILGDKMAKEWSKEILTLAEEELRKIEQKTEEENKGNVGGISPNWSEEDEEEFQIAIDTLVEAGQHDSAKWLQSLKGIAQPKQEWSKEDERERKRIIGLLEGWLSTFKETCYAEDCKCGIDWLKSLRPQNNITDEELAKAKKNAYNNALDKIEYHSGEPTFDDGWSAAIDYIQKKSIRPQNKWKPSDEQIAQLQIVIDTYGNEGICDPILTELLFQLKKLKEE